MPALTRLKSKTSPVAEAEFPRLRVHRHVLRPKRPVEYEETKHQGQNPVHGTRPCLTEGPVPFVDMPEPNL